MASILKHLRSSTANKRPTASGLADGQIAINTASGTPALFFKDSASNIVKVGPAHVGATAPNTSPAGSAGNSTGELWVDNGLTTNGLKYYNGTAFINLTPSGTTSTIGLVELATDAETQAGTDAARAVTPSGLQSKISDSTSTSSSTTIASSTAVKSAYDLADAALPKAGGTITGAVTISPSGSLSFEGATDDSFETTLAVVDPTADRTITLPNVTGTVITTGDSGTVTSTMIADGTIVDADISATAEIAVSKLADGSARQLLQTDSAGTGVEWASNIDIPGTLDVTGAVAVDSTFAASGATTLNSTLSVTGAVTGSSTVTASGFIPTGSTAPTNGMYLPSANNVAISTNGAGRLFVNSGGAVGIGTAPGSSGLLDVLSDSSAFAINIRGRSADNLSYIRFSSNNAATNYASIGTPAVNTLGFDVNGSERLRLTSTGTLNFVGAGTAGSTQAVSFNGSAPVNSLVIDSTGKVGLGTSSPSYKFHLARTDAAGDYAYMGASSDNGARGLIFSSADVSGGFFGAIHRIRASSGSGELRLGTSSSDALTIDSSQRVGIGTTSPGATLDVRGVSYFSDWITTGAASSSKGISSDSASRSLLFAINQDEAARIDTSKRLLVGTSSARTGFFEGGVDPLLQVEGSTTPTSSLSVTRNSNDADGPRFIFGRSRGTGNTVVQSGDRIGGITYQGNDGAKFVRAAEIECYVDATPGTNDMPGRLVFSTTADGASSPTERARIGANGSFSIGGNAGTNNWRLFVVGSSNTDSTYAAVFRNSDASDLFFIRNDGGFSTGTANASPYYVTTASAANVFVTSVGYLQRSTSSARYKKDIETLENHYADAILNARPVWYKSIASGDTVHPEWGYWGFIAEEVAEIDPRLVFWKTHETEKDEDGNTVQVELEEPIAEGVQYDRFVPHLLNLIKRQKEQIEAMEARLSALEAS